MSTKNKKVIFMLLASSIFAAGCSSTQLFKSKAVTKPSAPTQLGFELKVNNPSVSYPLPVIENTENNSNSKKYSLENPIINILSGFNSIWSLNNSDWQNGGANGNGPQTDAKESIYNNAEIRNAKVWKENIQYCIDVTNNRTDAQALAAYYDDRRGHNYTVLDGFGPLTDAYKSGSGATTTIDHSNDGFDVNKEIAPQEKDKGVDGGTSESELGAIYDLVHTLRESNASTSGAKYFYSSPRPWRMDDYGNVIPIDDNNDGIPDLETVANNSTTYEKYKSSVKVIPALKSSRNKSYSEKEKDGKLIASSGRGKDGGYPSGHTNAAYLAAIAYAYSTPERFSEMLTKASDMGNNRIVAGMHSPFDVIGGRIQATAISAYAFSNTENNDIKSKAYKKSGEYFGALAANEGMSLYEYAHTNDKSNWADHDNNKKLYRERMTYGFSKIGKSGIAPVIPKGAESLLETRLPYLTADQRRAVLYTTAIDSGYPVLDDSNGWGRLEYVTAADGYGAFLSDVTVNMDASKGRFNAHDWWRNDIKGTGTLTKEGTGTLTLTGNNSYVGGTLVKGGTLEAESTTAFGTGDLYIQTGSVLVDAEGTLILNGNFTIDNGNLNIDMDNDKSQITTKGILYIAGGDLNLDFSDYSIKDSKDFTLITANQLEGKFDKVTADGYNVKIIYKNNSVIAHVETK